MAQREQFRALGGALASIGDAAEGAEDSRACIECNHLLHLSGVQDASGSCACLKHATLLQRPWSGWCRSSDAQLHALKSQARFVRGADPPRPPRPTGA